MLAAEGLAEALRGMGRYPEARALDEASFAWRRNALGSDHPETLIAAHDLAVDLRKLREVEASRHPLRDTLTRRRSVLGEDDPETLATAGNLGVTLRDLGDLADRPRRRVGVALRPPPAAPIRSSPSASR